MEQEQNAEELYRENDILLDYIKEYRKIIGGLMNRLREQDSEECKKIYIECHNSSIYQYYYLGSDSVQET